MTSLFGVLTLPPDFHHRAKLRSGISVRSAPLCIRGHPVYLSLSSQSRNSVRAIHLNMGNLNDRMINERRIGMDVEGSSCHGPDISSGKVTKPTKILDQDK